MERDSEPGQVHVRSRGKVIIHTEQDKESEPVGPVAVEELGRIQLPVLAERADGRFVALLETDLYSAVGCESLMMAVEQGVLVGFNKAAEIAEERVTPWRLILLGENPGDLLESQVAVNLAAPCQLDDPAWVKLGKGLWDWRIHGYDTGDFVYGINTPSYLRLIDFCAELGIEYLTIDDHWYKKLKNKEKTEVSLVSKIDIQKVMDHAEQKGGLDHIVL